MDRTDRQKVIDGALGSLGLFLIVLTGWAVERQQTGTRADALLARFVLAGVATIGWTVGSAAIARAWKWPRSGKIRTTRDPGWHGSRAILNGHRLAWSPGGVPNACAAVTFFVS